MLRHAVVFSNEQAHANGWDEEKRHLAEGWGGGGSEKMRAELGQKEEGVREILCGVERVFGIGGGLAVRR